MTIYKAMEKVQDLIFGVVADLPFYPHYIELFIGCSDLEESHRQIPRVHAHVFHIPMTICVTESIEGLSDEHKIGILLHEMGHIYGGYDDADADLWVQDALGIDIAYVNTMQWVRL
ncbi:MAG TPA: hypothetical protein ENI27_03685 [bacterium]|nr:hypothetical protein [bacterium]